MADSNNSKYGVPTGKTLNILRREKTVLEEYNRKFGDRIFDYDVKQYNRFLSVLHQIQGQFPGELDGVKRFVDCEKKMEELCALHRNDMREKGVVLASMTGPVCSPEFLERMKEQIVPALEIMFHAEDIHPYFATFIYLMAFVDIYCGEPYFYQEIENDICYTYFLCAVWFLGSDSTLFWVRCFSPNDFKRFCSPEEIYDGDSIKFEIAPKIPKDFIGLPTLEDLTRARETRWKYIGLFDTSTWLMFYDDSLWVVYGTNRWKKHMRGYVRSLKSIVKRVENDELSNVDYPGFPDVIFTVTFKNAVNEGTLNRITKAVQKTYGKSRETAPNYDEFQIKGEKEIQVFIDFGECEITSADKVYKAILKFSEDVEKITVEQ